MEEIGTYQNSGSTTVGIELNKITYSWYNINVFARIEREKRFSKKEATDGEKQILNNVTGICRPGELVAIMGASGAGKTTLLNVLTSRSSKKLRIEGDMYINGEKLAQRKLRGQSAYVEQEDLFIGTLTVKEQLIFQALLRMNKEISKEKRMERVEEVIQEMGLNKCKNTLIGIPGLITGISGGEKKRLSFACEVLTDPPLLFCDEPTTGLDSFMAQTIVSVMKTLAGKGKTIISTIHQPSSEVFALFNRLLLMAEGRVAYLGQASEAQIFFSRLNYQLPPKFNPADFFISALAIHPGEEDESRKFIKEVCDKFIDTEEAHQIQEAVNDNMSKSDVTASSSIFPRFKGISTNESPYKATRFTQFKAVVKRTAIEVRREPQLLRTKIGQTIIVSLIMGLIYLDTDTFYNQNKVRDVNGVLFILISQTSFQYGFAIIGTFVNQMPIFLKEHMSGMYSTDVYYLAKILGETPIVLVLPVFFLLFIYFMANIYHSTATFFLMAATMVMCGNVAISYGYLISCLSNNLQMALAIAAPLLIPLMIFGGFFLNSETVPIYFIWIKYISWFNYAYEIMIVAQWRNVKFIRPDNTSRSLQYLTGSEVIEGYGYSEDNIGFDFIMLFVLLIVYRAIAFLLLLRKSRHIR